MPVKSVKVKGKRAYRWGNHGKAYTYDPRDKASKQRAYAKAQAQAQAAYANGYQEHYVDSSNVFSFRYEPNHRTSGPLAEGTLVVTFLGLGPKGKRSGPGPTYAYLGVPADKYSAFEEAAAAGSAGEAVWDYLRIRGTALGHQHPYMRATLPGLRTLGLAPDHAQDATEGMIEVPAGGILVSPSFQKGADMSATAHAPEVPDEVLEDLDFSDDADLDEEIDDEDDGDEFEEEEDWDDPDLDLDEADDEEGDDEEGDNGDMPDEEDMPDENMSMMDEEPEEELPDEEELPPKVKEKGKGKGRGKGMKGKGRGKSASDSQESEDPDPSDLDDLQEDLDHFDFQEATCCEGLTLKVDRKHNVIRGVKVLGEFSQNEGGREYPKDCRAKAVKLYEGKRVNIDHVEPGTRRSYRDRNGVLRNVREGGDGLYADYFYNPHHELTEQLLWDAENVPGNVGFSHDARGRKRVMPSGKIIIEEIELVRSVDLVADPATAVGLFESEDPTDTDDVQGVNKAGFNQYKRGAGGRASGRSVSGRKARPKSVEHLAETHGLTLGKSSYDKNRSIVPGARMSQVQDHLGKSGWKTNSGYESSTGRSSSMHHADHPGVTVELSEPKSKKYHEGTFIGITDYGPITHPKKTKKVRESVDDYLSEGVLADKLQLEELQSRRWRLMDVTHCLIRQALDDTLTSIEDKRDRVAAILDEWAEEAKKLLTATSEAATLRPVAGNSLYPMKESQDMDLKSLTLATLREQRADLVEAVLATADSDRELLKVKGELAESKAALDATNKRLAEYTEKERLAQLQESVTVELKEAIGPQGQKFDLTNKAQVSDRFVASLMEAQDPEVRKALIADRLSLVPVVTPTAKETELPFSPSRQTTALQESVGRSSDPVRRLRSFCTRP